MIGAKPLVVMLIVTWVSLASAADLSVKNVEPHMVIQRSTEQIPDFVASGECPLGTKRIQLWIANQETPDTPLKEFEWTNLPATIRDSTWTSPLQSLPVGGEYVLSFHALGKGDKPTSTKSVEHVLVGDVWLAAGQSNMQQKAPPNADPQHAHVRILHNRDGTRQTPLTENGEWTNGDAFGPAMSFANRYYELTEIPVGILHCAAGGTELSHWFKPPKRPLFNMMAAKLKATCDVRINGVLWYQGESEDHRASFATSYCERFLPMRDEIRRLARNPTLPFLIVQLESWDGESLEKGVPFRYPLALSSRPRWPVIRDQQELIGAADNRSATVPALDFAGLHLDVESNGLLGKRAAQIAAGRFLGKELGTGPLFDRAWFADTSRRKIIIQFKNVTGAIVCPDDPESLGFFVMRPKEFKIDDPQIFDTGPSAKMLEKITSVKTIDSRRVEVTLDAATPEKVTIGYGRHIHLGGLDPVRDESGIPLPTFFNRNIEPSAPAAPRAKGKRLQQAFPTE